MFWNCLPLSAMMIQGIPNLVKMLLRMNLITLVVVLLAYVGAFTDLVK